MLGDAPEHMAQIGFGIETVELGSADQRVDRGRPLAALVRACDQVILSAEGDRAQRPLGGIVIDLDAAIIAVSRQGRPAAERICDRAGDHPAAGPGSPAR